MAEGYVAARPGIRALRARISPWRALVAGSAVLLAAAAIVMLVLWFTGTGKRSSSLAFAGPLLGVELDIGRGNVQILGGGRSDIHIRRTDRFAYGHEPKQTLNLASGVLHIRSSCVSLVLGTCAADYFVAIPDNVQVTVQAEDGNVLLADYRGSAQLTSRSGSVVVRGFCGFVLQATARQGDIDVATRCSPERLELRSDTGNVTAVVPANTYRVDADSTGGRVSVTGIDNADDAPWTIQALSGSGDVTVKAAS